MYKEKKNETRNFGSGNACPTKQQQKNTPLSAHPKQNHFFSTYKYLPPPPPSLPPYVLATPSANFFLRSASKKPINSFNSFLVACKALIVNSTCSGLSVLFAKGPL